jgi:hypothetical protein
MLRSPFLAAFALVLALGQCQAQAQVKPFKVTGGGIATEGLPLTPMTPAPHWAAGEATELGRYYGEGAFQVLQFTGPTTAEFDSAEPFVFVGANGDRLAFTYGDPANGAAGPGQVELFPAGNGTVVAVFVAEFNPVPELSTGRFARVVGGGFIMTAVTEPFVLGATDPVGYTWSGAGTLEFRKGNR